MTERPTSPSLSGSLSALSFIGLVQLLAAERRSGRLDLHGPVEGQLWLDDGQLVHAETKSGAGARSGEAALDELASIDSGTFEFRPATYGGPVTLEGSTQHLLMEAACRRDHVHRASSEGLPPDAVPSFAPVPEGGDPPRFTTLQWRILATIDGRRDIAAIAADLGLAPASVGGVLAELVRVGVLRAS